MKTDDLHRVLRLPPASLTQRIIEPARGYKVLTRRGWSPLSPIPIRYPVRTRVLPRPGDGPLALWATRAEAEEFARGWDWQVVPVEYGLWNGQRYFFWQRLPAFVNWRTRPGRYVGEDLLLDPPDREVNVQTPIGVNMKGEIVPRGVLLAAWITRLA